MHDQHATLGAKMADFGGWEMPIEYHRGGVLNEHAAVREAVGLFDVSHLGKLTVTGSGAVDFLNSQFTNDLMRIGTDKAQYSMLCNDAGGVVDDLIVYRRSDRRRARDTQCQQRRGGFHHASGSRSRVGGYRRPT